MATVGTFDLCAGFEAVQLSERRAVQTPDRSPVVRARQVNERPLRRWQLRWRGDTHGAIARIKQLWALAKGSVLNLAWTPPGGSAIEVRFTGPPRYTLETGIGVSIEIEIEEVF